jgi:hypothetical protein
VRQQCSLATRQVGDVGLPPVLIELAHMLPQSCLYRFVACSTMVTMLALPVCPALLALPTNTMYCLLLLYTACSTCNVLPVSLSAIQHVVLPAAVLYCLQYMHIPDRDRCNWLRERIETPELVSSSSSRHGCYGCYLVKYRLSFGQYSVQAARCDPRAGEEQQQQQQAWLSLKIIHLSIAIVNLRRLMCFQS